MIATAVPPTVRHTRSWLFLAMGMVIFVVLTAAVSSSAPAYASGGDDTSSVQQRIDEAMQARPGGTQISATEVLLTLSAGSSTGSAPLGVKSLTCL